MATGKDRSTNRKDEYNVQSEGAEFAPVSGQRAEAKPEGELTKAIERQTSDIPSGFFLSLGLASMATSALLQVCGRKHDALFIGQWVPTILIMGLYNKLEAVS